MPSPEAETLHVMKLSLPARLTAEDTIRMTQALNFECVTDYALWRPDGILIVFDSFRDPKTERATAFFNYEISQGAPLLINMLGDADFVTDPIGISEGKQIISCRLNVTPFFPLVLLQLETQGAFLPQWISCPLLAVADHEYPLPQEGGDIRERLKIRNAQLKDIQCAIISGLPENVQHAIRPVI